MPKLRDPQGHKLEATQEQLDGDSLGVCNMCGWRWSPRDLVLPAAAASPPEPSDDEVDSQAEEDTKRENSHR